MEIPKNSLSTGCKNAPSFHLKLKKNPIQHDNTNQDKHTTGNNFVEKNKFND